VLTEPPPRVTAVRVVPRIIERAINKALSKSAGERFATASDFVAALHGATTTAALPQLPDPAPRPRRRGRRAAAIAVVGVLAVGTGVAMASRAVGDRRPRTGGAPAHRQLTFTGTVTAPALSPDARTVAYVVGGRSLVVQRVDGGSPVQLVPSARSIGAPRWTGDGRALVVGMTRDSGETAATYLVPVTGGVPRKVMDDVRPFDAGPDSTVLVRVPRGQDRIEVVSLATGEATRTITLPDSVGEIVEVAWSPDRRWIAFLGADDALWVVASGGGVPSHVVNGARRVRWGPGSDALYFLRGPAGAVDLMRAAVDAQTGRPAGATTRMTSLLAADGFDVGESRLVHTQTTPGAQARTFVLGGTPRRVVEEQPFGEGTARVSGAAVSPDGRWVAYSAAQRGDRDIHIAGFGGGSARVLAGSPAREEAPAWSPDGSRLTFAREDSAGVRLVMADARTGNARRIGSVAGPGRANVDSIGPRAAAAAGRWSASGRHIAYYTQDLRRILVANLQRRNESIVRLPDSVGTGYFAAVPSPNGTQLLASTIRPGDERATLWLVFGNGRRWRRISGPAGETFPVAWHRNGWIYLLRNRAVSTDHGSVHLELWRMRGPTGRPELYASLPEGCGMSVSISGDATRGACNYVRVESDLYVASGVGGGSAR
jgi:Tol biopolymer transport system component